MLRNRVPGRFLTYFGNNFISQMVEEAIRGTSTLDLILTKKKKIVGEMKTDRKKHSGRVTVSFPSLGQSKRRRQTLKVHRKEA